MTAVKKPPLNESGYSGYPPVIVPSVLKCRITHHSICFNRDRDMGTTSMRAETSTRRNYDRDQYWLLLEEMLNVREASDLYRTGDKIERSGCRPSARFAAQ